MKDICYKNQTNILKSDTLVRFDKVNNVAYHLLISIPKGQKFYGL